MVSKKTKKISKKTLQNMKRMRLYKDKKNFVCILKNELNIKIKYKEGHHGLGYLVPPPALQLVIH